MPINTVTRRSVSFAARHGFPTTSTGAGASHGPQASLKPTAGVASSTGAANNATASTGFDEPIAGALTGGLTLYKNYDWTGASPLTDWSIVDGDDTPNNEKSASKPSNVEVVDDAAASGGKVLRLAMRSESYAGQSYTGVQMENFYSGPNPGCSGHGVSNIHKGYGQGSDFFFECRLKWTGFDGFWCGPWSYSLEGDNGEMDFMETINSEPPKWTLHSPDFATTNYAASNDGNWHRYGIRVEGGVSIRTYFDNALHTTISSSASGATSFKNTNMGLKLQAYVGGTWPDDVAGHTTPQGVTFPQYFYVDWIRIYR